MSNKKVHYLTERQITKITKRRVVSILVRGLVVVLKPKAKNMKILRKIMLHKKKIKELASQL